MVARFEPYGSREGADAAESADALGLDEGSLSDGTASELAGAFAAAAGVSAIGDALRSARELRAMDYVGWPVSWVIERLTSPDPVRKIRLGKLWDELRGLTAGPSGAQQAEIDNALTQVADREPAVIAESMVAYRPGCGQVAGRGRARRHRRGDRRCAAGRCGVDRWWRLIGVVQGLLLGCVLVGIAWFVALLVLGAGGVGSGHAQAFQLMCGCCHGLRRGRGRPRRAAG